MIVNRRKRRPLARATKVTCCALQNAASIAGHVIAAEAVVADAPKRRTTTAVAVLAWAARMSDPAHPLGSSQS
ncbi:hypothetical protein [Dokdonella sp.]|uniref:hypothetical protein n=1 Tax=Dokdonella sp. TaxID=2291710 RepID=UPI003783638C